MSSTLKLPSPAPLLTSCPLPLVTPAQQPAGSFPERTASPFSFQQLCPPDFPMPDIWERPGAGPIELPSFAPVWLTSSFGWNRPLLFGSVPAEIVSGRFRKPAEATPRTHQTPGSGIFQIVASPSRGRMRSRVGGADRHTCRLRLTQRESHGPDYRRKPSIE